MILLVPIGEKVSADFSTASMSRTLAAFERRGLSAVEIQQASGSDSLDGNDGLIICRERDSMEWFR